MACSVQKCLTFRLMPRLLFTANSTFHKLWLLLRFNVLQASRCCVCFIILYFSIWNSPNFFRVRWLTQSSSDKSQRRIAAWRQNSTHCWY
jgi:hypothetical protein